MRDKDTPYSVESLASGGLLDTFSVKQEYSGMVGRSRVGWWGGVEWDGGEEYSGMVVRSTVGWWGGVEWDGGEE